MLKRIVSRIVAGLSEAREAYGPWVVLVVALAFGGLLACYAQHGPIVTAGFVALVAWALYLLGEPEESDESSEFGATYDALRYERQQLDEVRRKAGACERLRIATDEFLRYRSRNKALGGHDGLEL